MKLQEIVDELLLAVTHAARLSNNRTTELNDLAERLRRSREETPDTVSEELQALLIEAATELNTKELKFKTSSELGIQSKLRHLIALALQRCLHTIALEIAWASANMGWEQFGNRLEDIEAPFLLNGPLESQAQAGKWAFFAVDLTARIFRARQTPESEEEDDMSDTPPTDEELNLLGSRLGEFCLILDLLTRWFPR